MGPKWNDLLLDVNAVGLEIISLSKLSMIKKTKFNNYIMKGHSDKYDWCSKCETLKCLWDALTIMTKSYIAHQLNYFKYVNMQDAHRNDHYTTRAFFIAMGLTSIKQLISQRQSTCMNNFFVAINMNDSWVEVDCYVQLTIFWYYLEY